MSENLESYHSSYSEDALPPIQAEDSSMIGELVVPTTSVTHLLPHLLPEFGLHGLQAPLIEPDNEAIQAAMLHQFVQSPVDEEVDTLPLFVSQQETEEGYNNQRAELVASSPNLSNLLSYFICRQQDTHHPSPPSQEPAAALIAGGHMIMRNRRSRDRRSSDSPPKQSVPAPPSPGIIQHCSSLIHQLTALENETNTLIRSLHGLLDVLSNRMERLAQRFELLERRVRMVEASRGEYVWRVGDIDRLRREAVSGRTVSHYSPSFFVRGYKMCARLHLNGDGSGQGTHLSLFLVLMRGDRDDLLQWPFEHSVTLTLLDQSGRKDHISHTFQPDQSHPSFQRPHTDMNIASGFPQFSTIAVLMNGHYVRNDVMYIRVKIKMD